MKIYTKTGDRGDTGLFGGGRVGKDHPRVQAYGEVDELNAVIGVVLATEPKLPEVDDVLATVQRDLFGIGALLATPDIEKMRQHLEKAQIGDARIAELERVIDACDGVLPPLRSFVLPGGSQKSAALHLARTVARRAERAVVHLSHDTEIPPVVIVYLNRLSDTLFTLARMANFRAGVGEPTW
jgi:cob(I)alamin adenosyltransferase